MKITKMLVLGMLIVAAVGFGITGASVSFTPYICSICDESFAIEAALVYHMSNVHDIDYQIAGVLPEYEVQTVVFKEYTPVAYYECPFTGKCFYTEPQLCCWLDSIS